MCDPPVASSQLSWSKDSKVLCICSAILHQSELRVIRKCLEAGSTPLERHRGTTALHAFFQHYAQPAPDASWPSKDAGENSAFAKERTKIFRSLIAAPEIRAQLNKVTLLILSQAIIGSGSREDAMQLRASQACCSTETPLISLHRMFLVVG